MPTLNDQPNEIAGNHPSQPADETTKMGADARNTNANSSLQPATPAMQAEPAPTPPPSGKELVDSEMEAGQGAVEPGGEQENREASPADVSAPANNAAQPNAYGGNFGNDVQGSFRDLTRADNQRADANRGEFGEQGTLGATHGGYGNQYRETNPAAEHPAAEATEEKYYGEGAARSGPQHNAYRAYDGQDRNPAEQGHAVRDTPAPPTRSFGDGTTEHAPAGSNAQDTRNLPGKSGEIAAFQNDNGSPTVGSAYAPDYGHTSGVGLPAGAAGNHVAGGPAGRNQHEDEQSSRGGYDNQDRHAQPASAGAPAPVNAPDAPQTPGYGYGHGRSEEARPGNPNTGDSRNGFGPAGSQEGDVSQGHGSRGGSYDDENPGARGPEYDNFTKEKQAQNYGENKRAEFRPADGDKPQDADDTAPRRNAD